MLEQRIQQHFIDSADLKYQAAQALSQPIASAVQAMLACVTGGGKVLACGTGVSASDAQLFASLCVTGFERDRPELAAVALTSDGGLLGSVGATGSGGNASQYLARQVRALGQPGDLLLEFDRQAIIDAGYDLATPIIISNSDEYREVSTVAATSVHAGSPLLSVSH